MGWRILLPAAIALSAGCKSESGFTGGSVNGVAVTAGDFDDIGAPLNRAVVEHATYEGIISVATWNPDYNAGAVALKVEGLLGSNAEMGLYEAIFLASGTRGMGARQYNGLDPDDHLVSDPEVIDDVRAYVRGGGTLLATDWTYDLVEAAWPDAIDFLGDDTTLDDAQRGDIAESVADVTDDLLERDLDSDTMGVKFDYSNWAVMTDVGPDTVVLARGDARYRVEEGEGWETLEDVPYLVSFRPEGRGRVVFSSFHVDAQNPNVVDQVLETVVGRFSGGTQ